MRHIAEVIALDIKKTSGPQDVVFRNIVDSADGDYPLSEHVKADEQVEIEAEHQVKNNRARHGSGKAAKLHTKVETKRQANKEKEAVSSVNLGPLEVNKHGATIKPKFNIGVNVRGASVNAGILDVRDGLKGSVEAAIQKTYKTECHQLAECFRSLKARSKAPGVDHLILGAARMLGKLGEVLKLNKVGSNTKKIEAQVAVGTSVGVSGELYLGWKDTKGWHMIGAGVGMSFGPKIEGKLRFGYHKVEKKARIGGSITTVDFDVILHLDSSMDFAGSVFSESILHTDSLPSLDPVPSSSPPPSPPPTPSKHAFRFQKAKMCF